MRNCEDGKRGFDQRAEYRPNDALYVDEDPCLIWCTDSAPSLFGCSSPERKGKDFAQERLAMLIDSRDTGKKQDGRCVMW
jgi:hypothetical protein